MIVSGATGAVGSIASQLGKIAGAKVFGIAGGKAKCDYAMNVMGLDGCIDYKSENINDAIKRLCPNGVDCYFDNVGGNTLEAVIDNMNCFGRIAFCGAISSYIGGMGEKGKGPRNFEMILMRRLTVQGFICVDHLASVGEAFNEIGEGLKSGKIKFKEDIKDADITDYVKIINLLYSSGNDGKLIIKLPKA
jgi:NADPH-dependent curcumin reductase CurA